MLPFSSFYLKFYDFNSYICIAKHLIEYLINFSQTSFCKKLAKVIVTLNRASSIGKQNKEKRTKQKCQYLPVPK